MSKKVRLTIELIIWALLVLLDQVTKTAAVNALKGKSSIQLIPGVLEFYYVENKGAAFSMLENATWFFYIVAIFAITVIAVLLVFRIPTQNRRFILLRTLLLLISAGAAGNLIDRIRFTYVRDFIYFSLINFPVFNVADIYVTCSTVLMVLVIMFYYKDEDFLEIGIRP